MSKITRKGSILKEQPNCWHKWDGQDKEAVATVGELLYKAQADDKAQDYNRGHQERCQECDNSDVVPQEDVEWQLHYINQETEEGRGADKLFLGQVQKKHVG